MILRGLFFFTSVRRRFGDDSSIIDFRLDVDDDVVVDIVLILDDERIYVIWEG